MSEKTKRTCPHGHVYFKSSGCPVCPICESQQKPQTGFLSRLGASANRALAGADITTLVQLSSYSEKELLVLHGIGLSTISKLKEALEAEGLALRD